MPNLLIVILSDLKSMPDLLQAWQDIGVPGVTITESAGGYRTTTWLSRVGLGALDRLFEAEEVHTRTLLAAIEDEELLARAVAEAERVVGDFEQPDSGLLLVLPVVQAKGLHKAQPELPHEAPPPAVQPDWMVRRDTPVEKLADILNLEPVVVHPDTPLDEVVQAVMARPNVQEACVVAEDGRLVGLLDLQSLADDLFFRILPEEFLSELTDLEDVMQFADRSRIRTAADAMQEAVWVKRGETVKEAFRRMHEHRLSGLPVVDERYRIIGYINLLELLTVCLKGECSLKQEEKAADTGVAL